MPMNLSSYFDYDDCAGLRGMIARESRQDPLFTRRLFDAIAPIAIYHMSDVGYMGQAKAGMVTLLRDFGADFVNEELFDGTGKVVADFVDEDVADGNVVEDISASNARLLYNRMFAYVAEEVMAADRRKMEFVVDSYGGLNYHLNGEVVFGSDDAYAFPWFESYDAVQERYAASKAPASKPRVGR